LLRSPQTHQTSPNVFATLGCSHGQRTALVVVMVEGDTIPADHSATLLVIEAEDLVVFCTDDELPSTAQDASR